MPILPIDDDNVARAIDLSRRSHAGRQPAA